jgi:putative MATE family efflux protein
VAESTPARRNDLTRGSIPEHFKNMALPMAVGMIFSTLYNVVDTFYAGLISTWAQAGLAIASQVFFFLIALGFGLSSALSALVGQALGADNEEASNHIARQGVGFGILLSLAMTLVGYYLAPEIIELISEPGEYREAANSYLRVLLLGTVFFLLAYGGNGILQAHGDTRSMKRAQIAAFFANLALNPLFIFGIPGLFPAFGFDGLALSTLASQAGVMAYILFQVTRIFLFKNHGLAGLVPDLRAYLDIINQALPSSFSMMVMMIAGFVVQYFLKDFGSHAQAGYGVALRIEQILLLPVFGLTGSLLPIAAQNIGARQYHRVKEAALFCFKFGAIMTLISGALLWLLGEYLMLLFTRDQTVIDVGVSYLRVDGLILWVYMLLFAFNSLFQAFKKPVLSLLVGIYRQGIGVALFSWLYVVVGGFGVWGVWFGIATSVVSGLFLSGALLAYLVRKETAEISK